MPKWSGADTEMAREVLAAVPKCGELKCTRRAPAAGPACSSSRVTGWGATKTTTKKPTKPEKITVDFTLLNARIWEIC